MEDSLLEIPITDITSLVDLYPGNRGLTARVAIREQIIRKNENKDYPVKVYLPYGDRNEGLVDVHSLNKFNKEIGLYSMKDNPVRLIDAVRSSNSIDLTQPILFASVTPNVFKCLKRMLNCLNFEIDDDPTFVASISNSLAEKFVLDVPSDVEIRPLTEEFTKIINETWSFRHPGSEEYFGFMIKNGLGHGVYGKQERDLRAWIFNDARGDLHSLYVQDNHRRKRYGELLVKYMSKMSVSKENEIYACIVVDNEPSKNMFLKLGFELGDYVQFITINFNKYNK